MFISAVIFVCFFLAVTEAFGTNYQVWCQGNCDRDAVPTSTKPGVVLMGGGVSTKLQILLEFLNDDILFLIIYFLD
jgi:hypothetical protein